MAETMKALAREIERLRVEMQRTSIKQKEDIPELTSGPWRSSSRRRGRPSGCAYAWVP